MTLVVVTNPHRCFNHELLKVNETRRNGLCYEAFVGLVPLFFVKGLCGII